MSEFEVRIVDEASEEDRTALENEINRFNVQATGYRDGRWLACFLRDNEGALVAGISGFTWGGYAQIDFLWVTTELRAQGLGRRLVEAAEAEAKARGCRTVVVSSHSFQAPAMYRRLGYAEIGAADDAPIGARHFYFQKVLAPAPPSTA
jgi:ribosomal protein S18 acetylase RimI-like enzyme